MNILFMFGNGFDINLGLDTSYDSFYKYLVNNKEKILNNTPIDRQEDVNKIIDDIFNYLNKEKSICNWSDFELALAKFYDNSENLNHDQYVELVDILSSELSEYLEKEDLSFKKKVNNGEFNQNEFFNQLLNFYSECPREIIPFYKNIFSSNDINFYFLTFNYTKTLEYIINKKESIKVNNKNVKLVTPTHVHGTLDEPILIGVDNIGQFNNPAVIKVINNYPEQHLKPIMNSNSQNGIIGRVNSLIDNAHVIVVFGLSMGDTDLTWWRKIGSWYLNANHDRRLVFFNYNKNVTQFRSLTKYANEERKYGDFLLKQLGINSRFIDEKKKISIITNTNYFLQNLKVLVPSGRV